MKTKVKVTMEFEVDMLDFLIKDEIGKLRKRLDSYVNDIESHIDIGT